MDSDLVVNKQLNPGTLYRLSVWGSADNMTRMYLKSIVFFEYACDFETFKGSIQKLMTNIVIGIGFVSKYIFVDNFDLAGVKVIDAFDIKFISYGNDGISNVDGIWQVANSLCDRSIFFEIEVEECDISEFKWGE